MKTIHYSAIALIFSISINFCSANEASNKVQISWNLLGPAFSKHFSKPPVVGTYEAIRNDGGNELGEQTNDETLKHVTVNDACKAAFWGVKQLDCITSYSRPYLAKIPIRKWNQNNIEIGIQRVVRDEKGGVEKISVGLVVDSYKKPSIFLAKTDQKMIYESDQFMIDAGISYLLWFRSVGSDLNGVIKRRFVVGLVPTLTFENKRLGSAINLMYAPPFRYNGSVYGVSTLMLQFAWKLK